jgi:hypothetical protein
MLFWLLITSGRCGGRALLAGRRSWDTGGGAWLQQDKCESGVSFSRGTTGPVLLPAWPSVIGRGVIGAAVPGVTNKTVGRSYRRCGWRGVHDAASNVLRIVRVVQHDMNDRIRVWIKNPLMPPAFGLSSDHSRRWQTTAHKIAWRILHGEKATPTVLAFPQKELLAAMRAGPATSPERPARFLSLLFVLDPVMALVGTTRTGQLERSSDIHKCHRVAGRVYCLRSRSLRCRWW